MVLNQEENMCNGVKFDNGCLLEECTDKERKDLVNIDDYKFDEGSEEKNIADLLPNDPFGMEFGIGFPDDPVGMDFDITLPVDPFGMDFNIEATVAAITGWIEDFGLKAYKLETDEASEDNNVDDNNDVFAELNFVWTSSMTYEQDEGESEVVDASLVMSSEDGSFDDHNTLGDDVEEFMCFGSENYHNQYLKDYDNYQNKDVKDYNDSAEGAPADALFFVLGYLGVKDLLSVESVSKGLCDAVQNDPLLWRNIHIDYPLSDKITDDDLLRVTNRAQGTLCSLSLVKCLKITNNGLKHVLKSNLGLAKLSVPGCIKVSVEGILHDLKVFNSIGLPGIKHLRIGELVGLTNQHFKEFKLLLGADEDKKSNNYKPRFYRAEQLYLSLEDERAIDIETCPECQQARQVYDCPSESCQEKIHSANACRACIFCIARCISCGCCLDNKAYEETFCLDLLCLDCLAQLLNNSQDRVTLSPSHTFVHQKASYHFFLCG
ncbi:hypothetical protein BUALT_Bualt04G0169200 [Buddleja alternifolia]|uniref:F-box domain-containing protein n=1 Tax=Buddleja alternifolia TaxID=168488 RepID=A0AAV6XPM5_9LAMI|nr:hypothetical protein BUALT_Bualt04G0169200 [Buddleja alternifolia]